MAEPTVSVDEYLIAVGKVMSNAAIIDAVMCSAFRVLSGCSIPVSSAIFYTFDSLNGKTSFVEARSRKEWRRGGNETYQTDSRRCA